MKKLGEHFKIYTGKKIKMNLQVFTITSYYYFKDSSIYMKEIDFVITMDKFGTGLYYCRVGTEPEDLSAIS